MSELSETDKIGKEFDQDACDFCNRYKRSGLSRSSRLLLDFILQEGVYGKSAVDLGCGTGGFAVEFLKQGGQIVVGLDLSPKMIDSATNLAMTNGFVDRARFQIGNAATAELPFSDIVIMDKVLCCYSEWRPLLKNAMGAGKTMVGLVVPRGDGIAKIPFRLGVRVMNFFQKRRCNILFYLHPLELVDRTLHEAGFTKRKKQASRLWLVFLYSRLESINHVQDR